MGPEMFKNAQKYLIWEKKIVFLTKNSYFSWYHLWYGEHAIDQGRNSDLWDSSEQSLDNFKDEDECDEDADEKIRVTAQNLLKITSNWNNYCEMIQ